PQIGQSSRKTKGIYAPHIFRTDSHIVPQPLMSFYQLVQNCTIVSDGLIWHDPASRHKFQLPATNQPMHISLGKKKKILIPPHGEKHSFCPYESHVWVLSQLVYHVIQNVSSLVGVVFTHCFEPAWIVVAMGHHNHRQAGHDRAPLSST
ncbi:hypothetical protein EGW08_014783, partial [Elysia chlorotica]